MVSPQLARRLSAALIQRKNQSTKMTKAPYITTLEEQALAEARRQLRQAQKTQSSDKPQTAPLPSSNLLPRRWLALEGKPSDGDNTRRVTILTWNLLAQCLVRRELFPTSDCLKAAQREPLIHEEIIRQNADILCLQEVDRLERLYPMLEKAGYAYHYASGPRKLHGCLIAFKRDAFSLASERVIFYDEETIGISRSSVGASFKTRNIANLVALKRNGHDEQGLIVATTHLFWHPRYTYERIRQAGIMIREAATFKQEIQRNSWPIILAGDFNFDPSDPGYSLMRHNTLLPAQVDRIIPSMVVHKSIDPSVVDASSTAKPKGDDDEEAADPDRVITNARLANTQDGLLSVAELQEWFAQLPQFRSMYDDGLAKANVLGNAVPTFGQRVLLPDDRHGRNEPEYTSYTHYWQSVLDYIFVSDTLDCPLSVSGLLTPLTAEDMTPGLPQKRVSGSDHTCLKVELTW